MIVVRLVADASPDLAQLRRTLTASVPGAILDDHRAWTDRMRTMARTSEIGGIGILLLMLIATVLSVTFATRGAMATNRPIVASCLPGASITRDVQRGVVKTAASE